MSADVLSTQDLVDALSTARRRAALRELDATGEQTLRTLSEAVTRQRVGETYSADDRKRNYITLYQSHLPTLVDLGVVDWDGSSSDPVTPTEHLTTVVRALDALEDATKTRAESGRVARFLTGVLAGDGTDGTHEVFTP